MQIPIGLEDQLTGVIDLITMKAYYNEGDSGETVVEKEIPADFMEQALEYRKELIGKAADFDDEVGEKFLMEEEVSVELLKRAIRKGTLKMELTPVYCGSAYKNKGVQKLLDGVADFLPNPSEVLNEAIDNDNAE